MKPSFKLTLLAFSILSVSPAVLAQNYAGTVGDLNAIFEPPMNINGSLCDVNVNSGNEHAYKACSDGVGAARWMAEKYAKNTGKYLGCLDGYYQGVADGFDAGVNPTPQMTKEAQAYVQGANFDSAQSRGLEKASAEGQTESADQIISRYRSVVNSRDAQGRQILPNKDYNYPKVTFNGFDDGYEFDILRQNSSEFDAVYKTGWVTASSSFEDRLAARRALALQREFAKSLCDQTDTIFGRRGMPVISIWDFFRANRQVNFQNYGWRNPDWAWEIFDRDERTLEQYLTFKRLENLTKKVSRVKMETVIVTDAEGNPVRKLDEAGQPVLDAQGKPVFVTEQKPTSEIITTEEKLSAAEVDTLKKIYINGFKQAYDRYYARQYASINYHQEGMDKYKTAKIIGQSIGVEVAGHIARREAYNNQYKLQSAKKYAEEVKRLYKISFDRLINIFENNPVIELNEANVVGQIQDAIFRPGEEIKIDFDVTNLGEKTAATKINFESTADLQAAANGFSFTAPVLTRSNYVSNVIGRVSDDKEARSAINVGMAIRNPGDLAEVAKSLVIRKQKSILLNDYTEIDGVNGTLNYLNGSLSLVVNVKNPAKNVEAPVSIVEANMGNLGAISKNVEPIAPGASRQVVLNLESLDPLSVIIAGTINGTVHVRMANKIAHRQTVSYSIPSDRSTALVTYFDALATKKTNQTGSETKDDRLAKLVGMMESLTKDSIEANVLWKKQVGNTVIGLIQKAYNESKRANRLNQESQEIYNQLGKVLASHVNDRNFRAGGGARLSAKGNKKAYLKEIAKFAKIETNPNKY